MFNVLKRQSFHQLRMSPYPGCHEPQRLERKRWILNTQPKHVVLIDEEQFRVQFGDRGGRVGSVIEHGDFTDDSAGGIHVHHLFPALGILLKNTYLAVHHHEKAFGLLAGNEQHFAFLEAKLHRLLRDVRELFLRQTPEEWRTLKGRD